MEEETEGKKMKGQLRNPEEERRTKTRKASDRWVVLYHLSHSNQMSESLEVCLPLS